MRHLLGRRSATFIGAGTLAAGVLSGIGALQSPAGAAPSCSGTTTVMCTFSYTGAVDSFTVPSGVTQVTITTVGAGGAPSTPGPSGGNGASATGTFVVSGGQILDVVVGQGGRIGVSGSGGGGGGGSFVFDNSDALMIAAGGGGGAAINATGGNAPLDGTAGSGGGTTGGAGGTNGAGGAAGTDHDFNAGGGGGTTSAGTTGLGANSGSGGGQTTATTGGAGGTGGFGGGAGGFGGGGGGGDLNGGGGGGYSGGGGGGTFGGGGALFNNGTNQSTATGAAGGGSHPGTDGSVTISYLAPSAPAITSANTATFNVDSPGSFTVTTTGVPTPSLSKSGTLPSGVTFTDEGNGQGLLSGTPAWGTSGTASDGSGQSYPFTITATNGVSPDAVQSFTLVVDPPSHTWTTGTADSFTVVDGIQVGATIVHPYGSPGDGKVPNNLSLAFKPGGDTSASVTISGTPAPNSGGTYHLKFVSTAGVSTLTQYVNVVILQAPIMAYPPSGATVGARANTAFSQPWSLSAPATTWPHITQPVTITLGGAPLPIVLHNNGNGSGTITGTLSKGTHGPITITATSSVGTSSTSFSIKSQ